MIMARRTKSVSFSDSDITRLATSISKAVVQAIEPLTKRGPVIDHVSSSPSALDIEDKVVAMSIDIEGLEGNIQEQVETIIREDAGLQKSKSKLAALKGKK